jgi:uncharacterized membrane protein YhaH (DUF805 family)
MQLFASISPAGRLARARFAIGIAIVYVLSFLTQALLSAQVTGRLGLWPFAVTQAALTWAWYVLHARRLRDAARGSGTAVGIAILYAMVIVLVLLIMAMFTATDASLEPIKDGQGLIHLFAVIFFFSALFGTGEIAGTLGYWLMAFGLLMLTPVLIAFAYSIWAATRPSAPAAP